MFRLKKYIKMFLQNIGLPVIYALYRHRPIQKGLILFADAHHEDMPFAMRRVYEELTETEKKEKTKRSGYAIELFVHDFSKLSFKAMVSYLFRFMRRYAEAEYVFICDYFLPAAACRKRPETTVVQLWHSCGLMKKIAYDAGDDIPKNYRGNMFGNYSLLTLSAQICVPVHERALRLSNGCAVATGVSRTDYYFDERWNETCREQFFHQYPQAEGKKIAVWAPTFRGNAAMPYLEGLDAVKHAAKSLEQEWFFVIKAHPHIDAHGQVSNCTIPTEELLAVADVLITDYSSVLFDYLLYDKPAVLFAPDLAQYEAKRGFYLDYRKIPFPLVEDGEALADGVAGAVKWMQAHRDAIRSFRERYVGACDGHATQRILSQIGLLMDKEPSLDE